MEKQTISPEDEHRLTEIFTEMSILRAEQRDRQSSWGELFRRPTSGLGRLLSKGLAPLPDAAQYIQPSAYTLRKVRRFRLAAFGLVVAAISLLIGLVTLFPWMRTSPATLITNLFTGWLGRDIGGWVALAVVIFLMIFIPSGVTLRGYHAGKFIDRAAMFEEQWFRMGAENWTILQRIHSSVAFGLVHIVNIIYPIASLIVVGLVGGVFMLVYLREFKKTGGTELATIASAKLHATYNRFAFLYLFAAIGISFGYVIVHSILT